MLTNIILKALLFLDVILLPDGCSGDSPVYSDVEVDQGYPGNCSCQNQLHVLLVDLVVEDVLGEVIHAQVNVDLEELGKVEDDAEEDDGEKI